MAVHERDAAVGELTFALRRAERAGDTAAVLAIAEGLQSMDEYRQSVRAARELLSSGIEDLRAWRLAYPPAWPETVLVAAEDEGVDPALIWAVMRQESAFSEVAVSVANAQGLMQVEGHRGRQLAAEVQAHGQAAILGAQAGDRFQQLLQQPALVGQAAQAQGVVDQGVGHAARVP